MGGLDALSFGFDVLLCSRCGGQLRLIATIEDPAVIRNLTRDRRPATRSS